ncbi:tetratricopeptide repeat-containing sensor histidine kinase [Flavobacterium sp. NKUCC04_CG]|uniref:tetratricopeptide repeat-containing sensor histidine kinase n=1 Tax=Flavobacterium sp. NKUCC04_CG TaxID=2842121 RepID=UPI001C5ABCFA|nr:tetratricopeptide repeat-containing sensor histidine kinase [Flavobacterium sp. NKUCC04_CG]MBW3518452.1 tetratricopeptide repeat protein [Flavobacterium sp. NKUCC04_CG]
MTLKSSSDYIILGYRLVSQKTLMKSPLIYILLLFSLFSCNDYNPEKATTTYQLYLNKLNAPNTSVPDQLNYLDSISQLFKNATNTSQHRERLIETASLAYNLGHKTSYFKLSKKLYEKSKISKDSAHTAQALYFIGDYYDEISQPDSAYYYYSKSTNLYHLLNDTLKQAKTSLYKAGILFDEGLYNESEAEILKTLHLLQNTTDIRYLYQSYNLLAITLSQNAQHKEALLYQYKALETLNQLKQTDMDPEDLHYSLVNCYNNMGNTYDKLSEFKQAENLYQKGLTTPNLKTEKPALYAMLLNNLGNNYMLQNQHKKAFPLLIAALSIRDSLQLKPGIITSKIRLGDYYIHIKDTATSLKYWKEAYSLAKETQSHDEILRSLKLLSNYDAEKSQFYSDLHFKTNDSIRVKEIQTRNKFARIEYETNEMEQKNEILVRRVSLLMMALGVFLILSLAVFFIIRLKAKNRQLRYIQDQQNSKEVIYRLLLQQDELGQQLLLQERNRIAKELHDGIINTLFSIKLHLNSNSQQKEQLVADLESASEQIRQISHNLKDNTFAQSNFSQVIENLIDKQSTTTTAFESLIAKNLDWSPFSYDQKINIYRLLQEAIQNVLKHAEATQCFIVVLENATSIIIKIQDNGVGFNTSKSNKGIGLRNFDERVKELGGSWNIESKKGTGTTLKVVIEKK